MNSQNFLQNLTVSIGSGLKVSKTILEPLTSWFLSSGIKIAGILVVAFLINRALRVAIEKLFHKAVKNHINQEKRKRAETLIAIFTGTAKFLVAVFVLAMVLAELGVDIAPILAGIGVAGLAVGMAARDIISDFIAGLFIILEDQYNKGDRIKVAGLEGIVEDITLRRTTIRDDAGAFHSIPNSQIKVVSRSLRQSE